MSIPNLAQTRFDSLQNDYNAARLDGDKLDRENHEFRKRLKALEEQTTQETLPNSWVKQREELEISLRAAQDARRKAEDELKQIQDRANNHNDHQPPSSEGIEKSPVEQRSPSPTPSTLVRVKSTRHTLAGANVGASLEIAKRMQPRYRLGTGGTERARPTGSASQRSGFSHSSSPNHRNKSKGKHKANGAVPWENNRGSIYAQGPGDTLTSSEEADEEPDEDLDPQPDSSSEGSSDEYNSDLEETNKSKTKAAWARKGKKREWTRKKQKHQVNRLGREIIREALGSPRNWTAFAREGVTSERLHMFYEDPDRYGPKLRNTFIDKGADTTREIMALSWNRCLLVRLSKLASQIVSRSRDPYRFRFGEVKIKWKRLLRERLYRIVLAEVQSRPVDETETTRQAYVRYLNQHDKVWERCSRTNIRQLKYQLRSRISAIMVVVSRERGDKEAVILWAWVMRAVSNLRADGMSDEENDEEEAQDGQPGVVRKVKVLNWRHPALRELFEIIDKTPGFEELIFTKQGRARIPRRRVEDVTKREPPKQLYRSFFRKEFLDALPSYVVDELELKKGMEIPTFNFEF
ncbi:hypothetical protein PQX77_015504 [Marasmius sp. AFHP31]|nr:hypothetical protein PQX77_015504 [Marasmius sp. AFHP31]